MKPTKMRNKLIYRASTGTQSRQLGSTLAKDLRKKYGKRSLRVVKGDSVRIMRGEFKGIDGKVSKVHTQNNSVTIDGIKKEKTKGEKYDVHIHTSNLMITELNSEDKWRISRVEGKYSKEEKGREKPELEEKKTVKKKETE